MSVVRPEKSPTGQYFHSQGMLPFDLCRIRSVKYEFHYHAPLEADLMSNLEMKVICSNKSNVPVTCYSGALEISLHIILKPN